MRISEKTAVREIRVKAKQLYFIRVGAVVGLVLTFFVASLIGDFKGQMGALLILAAVELIFNFPYPFFLRNSDEAFKFLAASVMIDFAVETLAIHFVGGIDAMFFSAIYLLSILYCALNLPALFNFLMATLASLFYAGLIAGEYYDVIPHRPTIGLELSGVEQVAVVISHVAFFYLVAIFARYLVNALIDKEQRLLALFRQLREANQKIKYAHRMKSEFIAHMSHELRSPLNSIIGLSGLLKEPEIGSINEKQKEFLEHIETNGKHLLELINDVLDISKLEAKKTQMDWTEVNLGEICRASIDLFYEDALRRQVRLEFENVIDTGYKIQADTRKMRQILYNLLSNAIKFTPADGKVTIRLDKGPDTMTITVSDTGIGIAPEDQKKIFEPYEQVTHSQSSEMMGTGLGLAITQRFVEMHFANIHVESQPGQGTRFILTFPLNIPRSKLPNSEYRTNAA